MFYCPHGQPCKEGRSPFLFADENDDEKVDASDEDQQDSPQPSIFELREALSRSNSELEAREAFDELAALARQDSEAMDDGSKSRGAAPGPSKPASSSRVDPDAIQLLLQMVKKKWIRRAFDGTNIPSKLILQGAPFSFNFDMPKFNGHNYKFKVLL